MKLRDYQKEGVAWLIQHRRGILADEMGVGKTPQVIRAIEELGTGFNLIICAKNLLYNWEREIKAWYPKATVRIYSGPKRKLVLDEALKHFTDPTFVLCNYGVEKELISIAWGSVTYDEAHKLRNRKTYRYKTAKKVLSMVPYVFLLTGTPIVKHPSELIVLIQLLYPAAHRSYWRLVHQFFPIIKDTFGTEIGPVRNAVAYKSFLDQYLLRRSKRVLPELPKKVRRPLHIVPNKKQLDAYKQLVEELILELDNDELVVVPNTFALITRLRQLLVTPRLIGIDDDGAALDALKLWYDNLQDVKEKVVIYTPFKSAIPYIVKKLNLDSNEYMTFTGGMTLKGLQKQEGLFKESRIKAAICTIQVAEGFNLVEANNAFFLGADWNSVANIQAEDRLHRMGQTKLVNVFYALHKGTIDEAVFHHIQTKHSYTVQMFREDIK